VLGVAGREGADGEDDADGVIGAAVAVVECIGEVRVMSEVLVGCDRSRGGALGVEEKEGAAPRQYISSRR